MLARRTTVCTPHGSVEVHREPVAGREGERSMPDPRVLVSERDLRHPAAQVPGVEATWTDLIYGDDDTRQG
jgi:hypothetical protein